MKQPEYTKETQEELQRLATAILQSSVKKKNRRPQPPVQ
jgi:hypothetical protein